MRKINYAQRWETICRLRSLVMAADELGITQSALTKWYHIHRAEFPPDVRRAIRANSGRYQTVPITYGHEEWSLHPPTKEDLEELEERGLQPPGDFVEALFQVYADLTARLQAAERELQNLRRERAFEADLRR